MTRPSGSPECAEVVITADNADWLADFTQRLVEDRLVACGHNPFGACGWLEEELDLPITSALADLLADGAPAL